MDKRAALFLLTLIAGVSSGCKDNTKKSSTDDNLDRKAVLVSVADHVILPTYREVVAQAESLQATTEAYAAMPAEQTRRDLAREGFQQTMKVWQRAEVLQVGPAGSPSAVKGGKDYRAKIYAWPYLNTCLIDQRILDKGYEAADFFEKASVDVYGLFALEYLLFNENVSHSCTEANITAQWNALGTDEVRRRRADYAAKAAANLLITTRALRDAWEGSAGNFRQTFVNPESGSVYDNDQCAIEELFIALYYIELKTKDVKLSDPISENCAQAGCPERAESKWAKVSKENILANLTGFSDAFRGGAASTQNPVGFVTLLESLGATDLAVEMKKELADAIAAVEAIPGTFEEALTSNPDKVQAALDAVKKFTDLVKSQFISVLSLRIPNEGAADND